MLKQLREIVELTLVCRCSSQPDSLHFCPSRHQRFITSTSNKNKLIYTQPSASKIYLVCRKNWVVSQYHICAVFDFFRSLQSHFSSSSRRDKKRSNTLSFLEWQLGAQSKSKHKATRKGTGCDRYIRINPKPVFQRFSQIAVELRISREESNWE